MRRIGSSEEAVGQRKRLVPRRYLALALVTLLVVASERFGGPLTLNAIRETVASAADAAIGEARDRRATGEIHLTFDDGPSLEYTPEILDLLADHDATAVFFPIGDQVEGGAELLRRAAAEGHGLGNHTWDHDRLESLTPWEFDAAVGRTQIAIERATGVEPSCLRPPGGVIDDTSRTRTEEYGLSVELWTVDPQDWRQPGRDSIVDEVVERAGDGAVVLLHDGGGDRSQTVAALADILDRLRDRGYRFTALPGC